MSGEDLTRWHVLKAQHDPIPGALLLMSEGQKKSLNAKVRQADPTIERDLVPLERDKSAGLDDQEVNERVFYIGQRYHAIANAEGFSDQDYLVNNAFVEFWARAAVSGRKMTTVSVRGRIPATIRTSPNRSGVLLLDSTNLITLANRHRR